jgi:sugar lactone lactonase YvrE
VTLYAKGLTWGEGTRWHQGALWVSDPQGGGLWTDEGGTWRHRPLSAQPNGLWFLPDGQLAGAIMRDKRVALWDGSDFGLYADLSEIADGPLGDMVGDELGGLYVDDVGYAAHLGEAPKPGRILHVEDRQDRRRRVQRVTRKTVHRRSRRPAPRQ